MRNEVIKTSVLVGLLITFQIIGAFQSEVLPNFSPVAALLFCGFATMNSRLAWVTLLAWFLAYPVTTKLNGDYAIVSKTLVIQLAAFGLVVALAKALSKQASWKASGVSLVLGSLVSACLFYFVTNTASWLGSSFYTKDLKGFYEALWAGPANAVMPTWHFFRNSLAANALFTVAYALSLVTLFKGSLQEAQEKVYIK